MLLLILYNTYYRKVYVENNSKTVNGNYLVWIDCEMTGLSPATSYLLEIATIITDNQLNVVHEGPSLVINQPKELLARMEPVVQQMHTESGLLEKVVQSTTTVQEAQSQTLAIIEKYCQKNAAPLCGNSIWQDKLFLIRFMPDIVSYLNYRIVDVSSVKEVVQRWYPHNPKAVFAKRKAHRALDDIQESIAELRYYRDNFFKGD